MSSMSRSIKKLLCSWASSVNSPKKLRKTGKRLGYEGDALVDFVRILQGIDRHYCETEASRSAAQLQRDAKKSRNTTGR